MGFLLYISYHGAFIYSYGILLYGCIPSGLTMTKIKDYDLITVDEHRIQTTIDVYFQWKTLDIMLSTLSTRGINFPSEISENIVCYICGYWLNKGSAGDAIDPNGNRIIEIKGSSSTGPSAISGNTQGFPESFVLPDIADGRLYKQAGNSVCVSVVQRIAEQMLMAMK